jgi:hypothetical protein
MKNIIKIVVTTLLAFFTTTAFSIEGTLMTGEQLQYNSDNHKSVISSVKQPRELWQDYLDKYKLTDGFNKTKDGRVFFVGFATTIVGNGGSVIKSDLFIDERTTAYETAIIQAKSKLANILSQELESKRALELFNRSDEVAPEFREMVVEPLSIMEKAHKLTDLALDDQIKKYDNNWNGANKPTKEKLKALKKEIIIFSRNLSRASEGFIQGASPIFNAEGPNHKGQYSVGVGIVWSPKSTKVAEAIYNPNSKIPVGKKRLLTIKDQIKRLTEDEMATTNGTRIWWDENGIPVVVSFASADGDLFEIIAEAESDATAAGQIAQFVAEQIVAKDEMVGSNQKQKANGNIKSFNKKQFYRKVESTAPRVKLSGVHSVYSRYITHPISERSMFVNILMWSPASADLSRQMERKTKDQKTRMNALKGGTLDLSKDNTDAKQEDDKNNSVNKPSQTISVPSLEGVQSDPSDF